MIATNLLGSYECYAGGQHVENPALKREIRFILCSGGVEVEYGQPGENGEWNLHNVIPLKNISVEEKSVKEIAAAISGKIQINLCDAFGSATLFSDKTPDDQVKIAKEVNDPKKWDFEIHWYRDANGLIATKNRVDTVGRLVLHPVR